MAKLSGQEGVIQTEVFSQPDFDGLAITARPVDRKDGYSVSLNLNAEDAKDRAALEELAGILEHIGIKPKPYDAGIQKV